MEYIIDRGKIKAESGIPYLPRWFCDDLVSFEVDKYGILKVEYFNTKTKGTEKIFIDDMWGGMRFFIEDKGYHRSQTLKNCEVMPYGFKSEWHYKKSVFEYEQRVVNNTICIRIKPITLPDENLKFDVEFYDAWRFIPLPHGDCRYVNKVERVWSDWGFDNQTLSSHCIDGGQEGTYVTIKCNKTLKYERNTMGFMKNMLRTEDINNEILFVIAFDDTKNASLQRADYALSNYSKLSNMQNERYERVIEKSPILESPYKSLNNFIALAPLYQESCKIPSLPGAVHAKTEHYWVWGWDGMSSTYAYAYWGDVDFMGDMLKLYMESADENKGIGHWFARDMSHIETSMPPAQGFYISLLYQYYLNGGDITPYYEFTKKIFNLILDTEVKNLGLFEGYSLYPDVREAIGETGHDISAFNNSSMYCAIGAMEILAQIMSDNEIKEKASQIKAKMKKNYSDILFDEEKNYYAASADSVTLEKRDVYSSMALKWDNNFCRDLVEGKEKEILKFFEENLVCEPGILPLPVWGKGYDADANQVHCWWPVTGEIYSRLINFENRKDLIDKFISWISCWTDILMCPEGIDCYDNINEPKPDGWNSVNGTWHGYSVRAWYEGVIHSVVGIDFDGQGMNIYPYDGEEMSLRNLHFAGKTFDIHMKGSGTKIYNVILNGVSIGAVSNIQMDMFKDTNLVEIFRK